MGTWGPKLNQDDLGQDIKEEYEEMLNDGKSNKEAIEKICLDYKEEIEDIEEGSVFWLSLANILLKHKTLTLFVKEKALEEIKSGNNLKKWKEEATKREYEERKRELEQLEKKLNEYQGDLNNDIKRKKKEPRPINKDTEWKIGDTYAYKIEKNAEYEGQYFIFRKVGEGIYGAQIRYQTPIVYVQITSNKKLPKNEEEISELEYLVISNEGNVKHEYRMQLTAVPRKSTDKLIYLGNFKNIKTPEDEYIDYECNTWVHTLKDIEFLIGELKSLGTNKKPIYYEIDPKNISDSHIRFLMRLKYYKEILEIEPPEDAIVKNDPLLYIAFVDSLMIEGFVKNPVGTVTEEIKQEAYKRIDKLKETINLDNKNNKEKRINILNEFEEKLKKYTGWTI